MSEPCLLRPCVHVAGGEARASPAGGPAAGRGAGGGGVPGGDDMMQHNIT